MTLSRYLASAPTDALPLHCLELSHPDWAEVQRRVAQPDDYEVTLETAAVVTFPGWLTEMVGDDETSGQWRGAWPTMDDSGIVTRSIEIGDVRRKLMKLIESVLDSDDSITCIYRFYTSDDLAVPKIVSKYQVGDVSHDGGITSMTVQTQDLGNMRWPRARHTDENTPGWRGRW